MEEFGSIDEVLDFAIGQEEEAANFYAELAERAESRATRATFKELADQEVSHKAKLLAIKGGDIAFAKPKEVMDLKIADQVVDKLPTPDLSYQGALIVAMKREKAAFKMYSDLADLTEDQAIRESLLALAQEEAHHKLRVECEYDERVLTEN